MPHSGYSMPTEWVFCDVCYRNKCYEYPGCIIPISCSCPVTHDLRTAAEYIVEQMGTKWEGVTGHDVSPVTKSKIINLLLKER